MRQQLFKAKWFYSKIYLCSFTLLSR